MSTPNRPTDTGRSGIVFRRARADEASTISRLALRSKGHWGYSQEFLDQCRDELTYTAADCESGDLVVAETRDGVAGFYQLEGTPPHGRLASLFVDPVAIGTGIGRELLRRALSTALARGFVSLVLDADPDAAGFYSHFGARRTGDAPSGSVPGRVLPRMTFDLQPEAHLATP